MKTQKFRFTETLILALLAAGMLVSAACGSGAPEGREKNSADKKENVKPPAMDIHTAALLGDLDAIEQHILAGTVLDQREPTVGSSPLITAAMFGRTEVARALIEAGADVNLQNNEGSTPLHTAAFLCRSEIVRMLLDHGADRTLRNIYGSTPLESVAGPFEEVKGIYDVFSRDLGPLGLKLDYRYLEETRPVIADMLR
jgi:hypothetical protein